MNRKLILLLLCVHDPLCAKDPESVRVVSPLPATEARNYDLPGRTEPIEQARIFPRATGNVIERPVDIGDAVKAGDKLAVIGIPEIERQLESAKASVDLETARVKIARSNAKRSEDLLKSRAVSAEESEQRLATLDELEAALRIANAEVARLEELRNFAVVRAPFDGVIVGRRIDRGDFVRGDSAAAGEWAFHLMRLDQLRFAIAATPDAALRFSPDTEATVRFGELPGKAFEGKIRRSGRSFDTASGTMRVEILLDNEDLTLPAGLTGIASFKLAPAPGAFMLPNNTLVLREGKSLVLLVEDGRVKPVEVLPGRNLGSEVEVTSAALDPRSQVIVSPNAMLRPGDVVIANPLK